MSLYIDLYNTANSLFQQKVMITAEILKAKLKKKLQSKKPLKQLDNCIILSYAFVVPLSTVIPESIFNYEFSEKTKCSCYRQIIKLAGAVPQI